MFMLGAFMRYGVWFVSCVLVTGCGEVLVQHDAGQARLTVEKTGSGTGTVTSAPAGIDCGAQCTADLSGSVTLHAEADGGSAFVGWSGGGCSGTSDCVVNVTMDTTVTAQFGGAAARTLTVAPTGIGTISSVPAGIDCGTTCSASFQDGSQVTLTATTSLGTTFMGWAGACSGTDTSCTVTMDADISVSATFVCPSGSHTFSYTGALQVVNQPGCATSINVDVRGASGGASFYMASLGGGAAGGRVTGTLAISQGAVLNVYVGGAGGAAPDGNSGGPAGFNGGGAGALGTSGQTGGGGGGASDIRLNGTALTNRVFVAGGGGGAAACGGTLYEGGLGGGLTGGSALTVCGTAVLATGGTQSGGGTGGSYATYCSANPGTLGLGAPACAPSGGGGAGGGYYGGGGGAWDGGGGGSSFATGAATSVVHAQGFQAGNGSVIISW